MKPINAVANQTGGKSDQANTAGRNCVSKGSEWHPKPQILMEAIPTRRYISMWDKEGNSIYRVAEFVMTAERELAAFYEAVLRRYGPKEGRKAAQDWIEELETLDWPVDGGLPDWRHVTIVAADCLASRIIDHSRRG
jgi:hypothetical protein